MIDRDELQTLVRAELVQAEEEGRDVAVMRERIRGQDLGALSIAGLIELQDALAGLPQRADFAYDEPSDLASIKAARPPGGAGEAAVPPDLDDRILGAWLGRCAGCLLGKPVEGWPRESIVAYLRAADEYPLRQYFPWLEPNPVGRPMHRSARESTRGGIVCMPRDDDIDYTIIGLHTLERHGRGFTTEDMAAVWLEWLPYHCVYTAERVAYRNLVNGFDPQDAAAHHNPFREWIGAQIRADAFGYASPGRPEAAAALAFTDAALSHVKNGIYGEMWAAAMVAGAFGAASPGEAIRAGLGQIPASSRLAEALTCTLEWHAAEPRWEDAWRRVMDAYGHYHRVHTINNACCVALGLLYGDGDFSRTIGIAVECGQDTDCNGATAGSVLGAMLGARALPEAWTEPLSDRVRSVVAGYDNASISDLAARSVKLARSEA